MLALGNALSSARRSQKQAAELEDFDAATQFRDKAREAEAWISQAIEEAAVSD